MKIAICFASLALVPVLLMADPEPSPTPGQSMTNAPASSEDLAEHAALVQRLGAEAARGFDAEAHAHNLRVQIEQIVATPVAESTAPKPPMPNSGIQPPPGERRVIGTDPNSAPGSVSPNSSPQQAVQQAIENVRRALSDLAVKIQAVAPASGEHTGNR